VLEISYRKSDWSAVLRWDERDEEASWLAVIRRLALDTNEEARQTGPWEITIPWWGFVSAREQFFAVIKGYGLALGTGLRIDPEAAELLRRSRRYAEGYMAAKDAASIPEGALIERLSAVNFARGLSPEQIRNVGRLAAIPAGATFSVPGAGKTTEALATFFFKAREDERLLVIAPKNAFAAWDEQLADCMPSIRDQFVRLRGGRDSIVRLLGADPRFMLISYQQLARVPDVIASHCASVRVYVFLDESHRIKSGVGKQTARATLTLSHLPAGKLILSGTPMPQATEDLIPQFSFLYPEIPATAENVVRLIRPIYVRTTKTELGLPPVSRTMISLPMAPLQNELYKLMKFEVAREAASALGIRSKQAFRSLGRSVARLLMFVSNPSLLSAEIGFAHADLLAGVLSEGEGPKLRYALKRARALARDGRKVLLWSSFRNNVEYMAERLADVGAVYIHGGVDAGAEDDDETREGKIKLFHDDPNVMVLVANPAAAGEGVSLHRVCHHAIYLDRTFNAAHYLQSEDRIHRFGLPPGQDTFIEIIECEGTVDETVRERLGFKIGRMAEALEDTTLRPDPIPLDPSDIEDYEDYSTGLSQDDIQTLLCDFSKEKNG
jgi:hypothetical protein